MTDTNNKNIGSGKNSERNIVALVLIVIIVVVFVILFFMPNRKVEAPAIMSNTESAIDKGIVVTKKESTDTKPSSDVRAGYVATIETPVVSGVKDSGVQSKINKQISSKINEIVSDFKSQNITPMVINGKVNESGLDISFLGSNIVSNSILTIRLEVFTFLSGAAHPITVTITLNFDIKTGDILYLVNVLDEKKGTSCFETISAYATNDLKNNIAKMQGVSASDEGLSFFKEGADSNPENFQVFLIEPSGIRFIFTQYQVAPYAFGEQEVLMPYKEFKGCVKPQYVF